MNNNFVTIFVKFADKRKEIQTLKKSNLNTDEVWRKLIANSKVKTHSEQKEKYKGMFKANPKLQYYQSQHSCKELSKTVLTKDYDISSLWTLLKLHQIRFEAFN